jgi:regulator of replication initiation timing
MSSDTIAKKVSGNSEKLGNLLKTVEKMGHKLNKMSEEINSLRRENKALKRELGGVKKIISLNIEDL